MTQAAADLAQATAAGAQCQTELSQIQSDLAAAQAQLAAATADADQDGKRDLDDLCPNTASGAAVDPAGCSQAQFCAQFDATTRQGKRACKRADWNNNEPAMGHADRDCMVFRSAAGAMDDRCLPAN